MTRASDIEFYRVSAKASKGSFLLLSFIALSFLATFIALLFDERAYPYVWVFGVNTVAQTLLCIVTFKVWRVQKRMYDNARRSA